MQTSMGQTATTLTSLLDMNSELADGESEELIETHLLQARKDLIDAVRTGADYSAPLTKLVQLKCPVSLKYAQLNVSQLLKDNNESVAQLRTIPVALGMLEKYGRHLLKPPGARVDQWRQIKFNNAIFKDRVLPMQGAVEVVQQMGYSDPADYGLQFAHQEPDIEATSNLVADVLLARTEMDHYLMGKHPHPETIHALMPESTVDEVLAHWEQVIGAEAGTVNINPHPSSSTHQQVFHSPTPVSASAEAQSEATGTEQSQEGQRLLLTSHPSNNNLRRACDICGDTAATVWCRLCDNKQLCNDCDEMWHKHPKRQNHGREPIASLPSPSTVPGADAIMGPFGIRAVHSLSSQGREVERSPTPVSGSQSGGVHRDASRTPPPQQRQPTPPPTSSQLFEQPPHMQQQQQQQLGPPSHRASLQQHQQQLQVYLQQQQQQQQLLKLQQQQGYNQMNDHQAPGAQYPYSTMASHPSTMPQESWQNPPTPSRQGSETQLMTTPVQNSAFPPFPNLDPDPASMIRYGDAASAVHPSHQQRGAQFPQPDYSLRNTPQQSAGVGSATSAGYRDMSLRQPDGGENAKVFAAAPVNESSMFAAAAESWNPGQPPRRASSISAGAASMSESSLLKAVLAESDYEKRAAKCDIRLLTLDEDLKEVEAKLNDLMLNTSDFIKSPDFMTFNRHKARLMKEHQALSNYKQELADLMAAEPPRASHNSSDSTQIYHPPPLSSSPYSSYPSPQVSGLHPVAPAPTQQQLGFSYPHQASLSPSHTHESATVSAYQQPPQVQRGVHGNFAQSHISYHSPNAQESMDQTTMAAINSSVDRSSILPQWQMNPNVSAAPQPPVSQRNQPPFHPPPMYQSGNMSNNSTSQQMYVSPVAIGQVAQFSPMGQGRPVAQQPSGPHFPHSHSSQDFMEMGQQQDLNRPSSAPVNYAAAQPSVMQGGSAKIGFENMMLEEMPVPYQENAYPPQPQQPQHPIANRRSVSLTPSPPPARHTPPASQPKYGAPEQCWQCSHCTFINQPGTRVCCMCDRTSDSPTLVSKDMISEGGSWVHGDYSGAYEVLLPPEEGNDPASHYAELEAPNMSREQLAKFNSRIAEEQDQIYLEKKEAREQYSQSLQQQTGTNQLQKSSGPPSGTPPPLPSRVPAPPSKPAVPARRPPSTGEAAAAVSPQTPTSETQTVISGTKSAKVSSQAVSSQAVSSQAVSSQAVSSQAVSSHPEMSNIGSGGDHSEVSSLNSATSFIKEGDFSTTMERFSEQKKIKQLQLDGADLMHYVKMADRLGFQMEEMQAALSKCKANYRQALDWLRTEWSKLVQVVVSSTRAEGQRSDQNDVGDLSAEEARKALRESKGEMVPAVKSCVAKRKKLYANLNQRGDFAREEVLQAMLQSCGDEEAAREQLYSAMLKSFLDRVWKDGDGEGATASRTLLQMTMAESTCQSVSTSVISHANFQQTMMDTSVDRDRRIRMILVEGKLRSWGRADMVVKLLDSDLPNAYPIAQGEELPYSLEDVVEAVRNCRDRQSARAYLTQECSTCFSHYPMSKIRNLNFCPCKICSDCLKQNFEVVIREKHVRHWTCPICGLPDLNDAETASEYLSFLGMLLQTQVDREVYELFETRVRDWHLQKDPSFRWCAHCGNGFIADEQHLRMVCPHCGDKTCYSCKKQWEDQHEGFTCEQFAQWKIDNDPNNQAVGLARHLEENGIDCPSCKMRYALAKGGCMHFKCPQCGHEFCSGCYQPFYQRGMCSRLKSCKAAGLHAHHPRDCFFYLRDESVDWLQKLLTDSRVEFNTVPPESQDDAAHCPVIEQKEFDSGKCDESCGKDTHEGHAGLCLTHYKEYLVGMINKNNIDPVVAMTLPEIQTLLKRAEVSCPKTSNKEAEVNYRKRIIKFVKEKSPLPRRGP